ncbi:adenosine deaminase [Talaromyces stipitatus ATCC 10500]|uniref:Adenine deaminase n=1 Tax=Talaromyces stipitatus (strain ATCC 10500 / CBS 375.48 / QM 6759 / NRRL 1006) TaxID=441959 RepID=B8LT29_TALSN|nr:adenosine deaminase [Talaromyces stipitatus ATCC 10500]EED23536.1 adenosine deaminase [Talaromyces stipitatus ATCC 10500]
MSRRINPPRRVRRKLHHDYYSGADVESTITASSTTDDGITVREPSRSEPVSERPLKFIVALDFGTTNTSVSYIKFNPENPPDTVHGANIRSIRSWPDSASDQNDTNDYNANVPSESWYREGEYIWGYSVQRRMRKLSSSEFKSCQDVIKFSKLLLNDQGHSLNKLRKQLRRLNKSVHDVIRDYLIQVFAHTKKELIEQENFSDACAVELVICIPAGWSFAAQRDMQMIMWDVAERVDFGKKDFEPFIIHEPEAAAAHLLENMDPSDALMGKNIAPREGEVFIICDAGGGTVDAITYRVTQVNPYRFEEVVKPAGRACGSTLINDKMFQEAAERLRGNPFLEATNVSKEYLIQQYISRTFESDIKKGFTYEQYIGKQQDKIHIPIVGLRRDDEKDIGENSFYITSERMALHFKKSIEGTVELLKQQKENAEVVDDVAKIILAGGFSSSDALQKRIQEEFTGVDIITPKKRDTATIVSHGAVFRALNKEAGPQRKIMASWGVLQDESYIPGRYKAHDLSEYITTGTLDSEPYATNVIQWLIKRNKKLGKQVSFKTTLSQHFDIGEDWEVRQKLYASLEFVRDHYHFEHPFNAHAEVAGVVVANLNSYRDSGTIQPKISIADKEYYSVEYEIVLEVDGRNMKAKLYYPPGQIYYKLDCKEKSKMCNTKLHQFLQHLPKCEHHVHLEGCLTPELMFTLAARNGVCLPNTEQRPEFTSPETLYERYEHFTSLDDFLSYYFIGMSVLQQQSDFEALAWEYFQMAHADGVHHAEVFFDPQEHINRGVPFETVVSGFVAGCQRAEQEYGMTAKLIMCFVKHLPASDAQKVFDLAVEGGHFESGAIHGIGASSSEVGPPKDMFKEIYQTAHSKGIRRTAHAGEEGDPTYIEAALEAYKSQRIDHGVRLIDSPRLMEQVARDEILLTVCPVSNVKLRGVDHISKVPIRAFLDAGVKFSINSDDPAYFGGFILHNYCSVQEAFDLSIEEWRTIAENSIHGSWVDHERKLELLQKVDDHIRAHHATTRIALNSIRHPHQLPVHKTLLAKMSASTTSAIPDRYKLIFFVPHDHVEPCKEAIFSTGAGSFPGGKYTKVCFQTPGTGQFLPGDGAMPNIGAVGVLEHVEEMKVEVLCLGRETMLNAVKALVKAHPYEEVAYEVYKLEDV